MSSPLDEKKFINFSIAEIKSFVERHGPDENIIKDLSSDSRAGVRALAQKLQNRKRKAEQLMQKEAEMFAIEKQLITEGKKVIAGVDEAGRGPLAGPVVSAAVVLPEKVNLPDLDDSKKLTAKKREELFELITSQAIAWNIGMVDNDEIDEIGILSAAMKSMRIAIENLKLIPDIAIVDGNQSPKLNCEERLIVNGDARCRSIAAASIIAKVTRDRIMIEMDSMFPGYDFASHKGYGAKAHVDAIIKLGPCDIHRFSFKIVPAKSPAGTQSAILKKRLLNAPTKEAFDRAAKSIVRIRNTLHESDIEALREIYRMGKNVSGG